MKDTKEAALKYIYFKDHAIEQLHLESKGYPWKDYEIIKWTQLSDSLWVANVTISSSDPHLGTSEAIQFVDHINGRCWVLPSVLYLPEELTEGLDLSYYEHFYDYLWE